MQTSILLQSTNPEEFKEAHELIGSFCASISSERVLLQQCLGSNAVLRLIVVMLEHGYPMIGSLWLSEEIAKFLPTMLTDGSKVNNVGVSHASIIVSMRVRYIQHQ